MVLRSATRSASAMSGEKTYAATSADGDGVAAFDGPVGGRGGEGDPLDALDPGVAWMRRLSSLEATTAAER